MSPGPSAAGSHIAGVDTLDGEIPQRLQLAWSAQRRAMREDADQTAQVFEAAYLSLHEPPTTWARLR